MKVHIIDIDGTLIENGVSRMLSSHYKTDIREEDITTFNVSNVLKKLQDEGKLPKDEDTSNDTVYQLFSKYRHEVYVTPDTREGAVTYLDKLQEDGEDDYIILTARPSKVEGIRELTEQDLVKRGFGKHIHKLHFTDELDLGDVGDEDPKHAYVRKLGYCPTKYTYILYEDNPYTALYFNGATGLPNIVYLLDNVYNRDIDGENLQRITDFHRLLYTRKEN